MSWRARDHDRKEMWDAKCAMCGKMARIPWDPKTSTQRVLCRDCRAAVMP